MHLEDIPSGVFGGKLRDCATGQDGCPGVMTLKDDGHAVFGQQWQYAMVAWNYGMTLHHVAANFGKTRDCFNKTGFPGRHNWIEGADEDQKDPNADKVRTFSRSCLTGVIAYSLVQAFREVVQVAKQAVMARAFLSARQSFLAALTTQNMLKVETFDSRQPPPLKPGRSYPQRVEEIDPDDYAVTPWTHFWMFAVKNIVNGRGEVKPYPHGAVYTWTGDGLPYTFHPHISNHGYGDVLVALSRLMQVTERQSPYRFEGQA